jgi:diamine N-acetyltransferase
LSGVRLVPVTRDNLRAVCALDAGDGGVQVAPNVTSMAQAAVHPEAWPRAIEADGQIVGFVMLFDPTRAPPEHPPDAPHFYLWRLMIDRAHQRHGHGRAVVQRVIEHVRARQGTTRLLLSYQPPADHLVRFYASFGFEPTGDVDDGEIVMALDLARWR